jgi:hypothetical protein
MSAQLLVRIDTTGSVLVTRATKLADAVAEACNSSRAEQTVPEARAA